MKTFVIACLFLVVLTATAAFASGNRPDTSAPDIETEITKLLDDYMSAWNRKDMAGWERTFHFPHYRLASGKMSVLDRPGLQDATGVGIGWKRLASQQVGSPANNPFVSGKSPRRYEVHAMPRRRQRNRFL